MSDKLKSQNNHYIDLTFTTYQKNIEGQEKLYDNKFGDFKVSAFVGQNAVSSWQRNISVGGGPLKAELPEHDHDDRGEDQKHRRDDAEFDCRSADAHGLIVFSPY